MCVEFPAIVLPFFVTVLGTMTPMYDGTPLVGGGLLPPVVVHALPQPIGGLVDGSVIAPAKPLNADGATPPLSTFCAAHVSDHHVTVVLPAVATVTFPSANAP